MAVILERIDDCNDAELPLLAGQVDSMRPLIEAGLADRDPTKRQNALCAIAKLQIHPQFHHLVRAAENAQDPQQMVAAELLTRLAIRYGDKARDNQLSAVAKPRAQLMKDLWQSIEQFGDHKMIQIVDAWLCASYWDDDAFKEIFDPNRNEAINQVLIRQLKHSSRVPLVELLVGVLWSKGPFVEAVEVLANRTEHIVATKLADHVTKHGITAVVNKNLLFKHTIASLLKFDFSSDANPIAQRASLLLLLTASETTPDILIDRIIQLLASKTPDADKACSTAIRNLRSLKPEIVVMVLSDCFDLPGVEPCEPPPWKTKLKLALERLIELYPFQSANVRSAIESAFSTYRCEELLKHLDDWPESHLKAYAGMVRVSETGFAEYLQHESQTHSAAKRARVIRVVRLLGNHETLMEISVNALSDDDLKVRVEAIQAIASGHDRKEAIEILRPLLLDDEPAVKTAVDFALTQLRGVISK